MQDLLTLTAEITQVIIAAYFAIPLLQWTFAKPQPIPVLEFAEYALEDSESPQPVYSLPSVPTASRPVFVVPVEPVVKKTRKPRAKKTEVPVTETIVQPEKKKRSPRKKKAE